MSALVFVNGPGGAGKTHFVNLMREEFLGEGIGVSLVNLDPGSVQEDFY